VVKTVRYLKNNSHKKGVIKDQDLLPVLQDLYGFYGTQRASVAHRGKTKKENRTIQNENNLTV